MSIVPELTDWFAPWQSVYSASKVLATGVTTIHLLALSSVAASWWLPTV